MNLGQFLTAKSPLPSGTVAQHLAAIAASVGTGPGETIFSSKMSVSVTQQSIVAVRKSKRPAETQRAASPQLSKVAGAKRFAYIATRQDAAYVVAQQDEVTVTDRLDAIQVSLVTDKTTTKSKGAH